VRIGACLHFLSQMEGFLDLGDQALVFENALASQYRKAFVRCFEHHSPARVLFILRATGNSSAAPELCPNTNVAAGMCHVVTLSLGFAKRRTIDDQLAIYEPKDSEMRCAI